MTTPATRGVSISGDLVAAGIGGCIGLVVGTSIAYDLSTPGFGSLGASITLMVVLALSIGIAMIAGIVSHVAHRHGPALLAIAALVAIPGTLAGTVIGPRYEPALEYRATVTLTIERPRYVELAGAVNTGTCSTSPGETAISWIGSRVGRIGPDALDVTVSPTLGTVSIGTDGGTYVSSVGRVTIEAAAENRSGTVVFTDLSPTQGTRPLRLDTDATRLAGRMVWSCQPVGQANDTPPVVPGTPPANDVAAGARLVSTIPFEDVVDISGSTLDPAEEAFCGGRIVQGTRANRSVWFAIRAPAGRLLVEAASRDRAIAFAVFGPFDAVPSTSPFGPPTCVGRPASGLTTATLESTGGTYLVDLLIGGMIGYVGPEELWVHVAPLSVPTAVGSAMPSAAPTTAPSVTPSAMSTRLPSAAPASVAPPRTDDLAAATGAPDPLAAGPWAG